MVMKRYSSDQEVPPQAARALSMASLVDSRGGPLCGNALKGRQRVCSGACRAKLIRLGLEPRALALKGRKTWLYEWLDFAKVSPLFIIDRALGRVILILLILLI